MVHEIGVSDHSNTYSRGISNMSIYRKIYEQHYGPIPIDEKGRTFEIHHIDGNRENNNPSNLKCVSIQEHYNIHYTQGDYSACIRILNRMNMSSEEISKKASEINIQRAKEGKHPSQTKKFKDKMRLVKIKEFESGNHPFCDTKNLSKWAKKGSEERVKNGTHHFLSGKIQSQTANQLLEKGQHNFQKRVVCPHCGKDGRIGPMKQKHFNNCKQVKENKQ